MSTNFFDKVKQGMNTGVTTVTAKSKELVEITKLQNEIKGLQKEKRDQLEGLGTMIYAMHCQSNFDEAKVNGKCQEIDAIDQAIHGKEDEIVVVQNRAQETINATKTEVPCQNCGASIPKDSKFCTKCGGKVETVANGPICICGTVLAPGAKFCTKCGSKTDAPTNIPSNISCECGASLAPEAKFCISCGSPVKNRLCITAKENSYNPPIQCS